jgi:uncharacterized protein (DUF885 family)
MLTRRSLIAAVVAGLATPLRAEPSSDYRRALAMAYGGDVDPLAAHRLATAATRRLQARADRLLRAQGLTEGDVGARLRALANDSRWLYPDDAAGRERAVADMNARLAVIRPRLAVAFGDLQIAPVEVRRMAAADEAKGRGGYREVPRDGQPGAYYVDLRAIRDRPAWTLPSVAFHELTPGHLVQAPLQEAAHPDPQRVRDAAAFSEAWATYAEQLAADLGAYADDPLGEIGFLQWWLFRLGRVVADTGLHARGWSRDHAVAAMTALQGQSIAFITIEADVERMIQTPGKAAAEGLGALALSRLRPARRSEWPAFHRAVLEAAPWRFGDLERAVRGQGAR